MPTPSTRTPVRIARGSYSNLNSSLSDLQDGEIIYAEDVNKLYIKEGSALVVLTQPAANPIFTGNATFDTNTLYVDGTNNRVGIGTTSPSQLIEINGASTPSVQVKDTTNNVICRVGADDTSALLGSRSNHSVKIQQNDATAVTIDSSKNATFVGDLLVAANKRVLIGTTTEGYARADNLTVYENGDCGITIRSSSSGYGNINFSRGTSGSDEYKGDIEYHHGTDTLSFRSAATVGLTLDSAQRVLIGETAAITTASNRLLQVVGDTNGGGVIAIGRNDTTLTNESLGGIEFYGNDTGSGFQRAASIMCEAAAEWTSNDYPTKIIFQTTPDGSSTNTLALTLDSSQNATFTGTVTTAGFSVDGKSTQVAETLSAASTITINCSTGNYFTLTAGQNTTFAFSNVPSSGNVYVLMLQVAVATYSLTWPAAVKWSSTTGGAAPTLTANKVTNFVLVTSDGGTTWRASANTDYAS